MNKNGNLTILSLQCKKCGHPMLLDYDVRDDLILTECLICNNCGHRTRRVWTLTLCSDINESLSE